MREEAPSRVTKTQNRGMNDGRSSNATLNTLKQQKSAVPTDHKITEDKGKEHKTVLVKESEVVEKKER